MDNMKIRLSMIIGLWFTCLAASLNTHAQSDTVESSSPNVLHVVLMSEDQWYAYFGNGIDSGILFKPFELELFLTRKITNWSGKLYVLVKPTKQGGYKAVVDILDILRIKKIPGYDVVQMSEEEEKKLKVEKMEFAPPKTEFGYPREVKSDQDENKILFGIEIREDNSIWYQPVSKLSRMAPQQVGKPVVDNLTDIIAAFNEANKNEQVKYMIKCHPKAEFGSFQLIINALKKNNISKYTLSTDDK